MGLRHPVRDHLQFHCASFSRELANVLKMQRLTRTRYVHIWTYTNLHVYIHIHAQLCIYTAYITNENFIWRPFRSKSLMSSEDATSRANSMQRLARTRYTYVYTYKYLHIYSHTHPHIYIRIQLTWPTKVGCLRPSRELSIIYIHSYIYTRVYIHTYAHTLAHIDSTYMTNESSILRPIRANSVSYIYMNIHVYTHAYTHIHTYMYIQLTWPMTVPSCDHFART